FGGIAKAVLEKLATELGHEPDLAGVLVRESSTYRTALPLVSSLDELFDDPPAVVVECAGHNAVHEYGEQVLRRGTDLIVVSTGALADSALLDRLRQAARAGASKLIIPPGALGAVDALGAAKLSGLIEVNYRGRKPPSTWKGTPAEDAADLDTLTEPQTVFRGAARQAALQYPKNSNVAATIALAGLGFDRTSVELVADPTISSNIHEIEVRAESGDFEICLKGQPSAANASTSILTAYSVVRALLAYEREIVI
ncbi:MAG: aspartate dehydrogenase, partial [Gammaproteobacteria bacterium]|nr:aspartate dehydrogenase [Gammaproteobacteria bacterium]